MSNLPTLNNHKSTVANLPRHGWIHECLICDTITSRHISYLNYKLYVCIPCQLNKNINYYKYFKLYKRNKNRICK
jgi:hypothetical protein